MIDVLIPAFNAAETIETAVASIQRQTISDIRIIVVDDGSTDATPQLLAQIREKDPRIQIISRPNGGIVDALNEGLKACTAEFVARHDADDLADANRFAVQIDYLNAHPECVAVSSYARHINKDGQATGSLALFPSPDQADPKRVPSREPYLLHPFLMVRRRSIVEVGGYRYAHHSEDTELYWRLREVGTLHIIPAVLGDYRYHAQSITSRSCLNGRLSAINSQLAAVAALRRARGGEPIEFSRQNIKLMSGAGSAGSICDIASQGLSSKERTWLAAAFAAKLLELTAYRPYELDLADCKFISQALSESRLKLTKDNVREIRRSRSVAVARLFRTGHARCAAQLMTPETFLQSFWRLAVQTLARLLPEGTRRAIRTIRASQLARR